MSMAFMKEGKLKTKSFNDGRTKQSFKDTTDINKILKRAQKTGVIDHLSKHGATYGDFSDFDYVGNLNMIAKGREIFDELPSEVRKEFNSSPADFFAFVNHPDNVGRVAELLPQLAVPGSYFLDARDETPPGTLVGKGSNDVVEAPAEPVEPPPAE